MNVITKHAATKTDGPLRSLQLDSYGVTPSWKKSGDGLASIKLTGHTEAKWLTVWITEHAEAGSTKRASYTLDPDEAAKLRDLLNEVLGVPSELLKARELLADEYLRDIRSENLDGSEPALALLLDQITELRHPSKAEQGEQS